MLCVDEKSEQVLERANRCFHGLGYVEGVTHDYKRHGTTTLFAALDVLTGQVLAHASRGIGIQNFLLSCAPSRRRCRRISMFI